MSETSVKISLNPSPKPAVHRSMTTTQRLAANLATAIEHVIIPRAGRTLSVDAVDQMLSLSPMQHTFRSKKSGSARLDMVMADHIGDMIEETLRAAPVWSVSQESKFSVGLSALPTVGREVLTVPLPAIRSIIGKS